MRQLTVGELRGSGSSAISDAQLNEVARELQGIGQIATMELMLRVGALVCNRVLTDEVNDGSTRHRESMRRLAACDDVPFSAASLWRAVSLYRLSLAIPDVFGKSQLGISHFRAVLGIPVDLQRDLLSQAAENSWTKRQLEEVVASVRSPTRRRSGRRRRHAAEKCVSYIRRGLRSMPAEPELLLDGLKYDEIQEMLSVLEEVHSRCDVIRRAVLSRSEVFARTREEMASAAGDLTSQH